MTKKQVIIVIINKFDVIVFQHCKRIAINVLQTWTLRYIYYFLGILKLYRIVS
ncbi:hypothetical protein AUC49_10575 [Staphylococcus aureus]|mgnify:FL=1|uniref:Uncharacterized protein n=2 Tax=Staphylococcus aureus TaxID=1280 RepID=A0AAP7YRR5_STAAU|nr:hypothetical protein ST398NM01_2965 [Staphylococcus aureus subsp. aureus 71193]AFR74093.1 Hypothetical Protein C248_2144 [Staphylococcus aureus 08BA02176]ALS70424.1 hypothetical protein AUC48_10730 [Staphylococcus aureus]EIA14290.1 hypothetical protein ST398NM02_2965 [Staphylococcus aureus subsp. aureus DR10]OLR28513.1 hypothetical protein WG79_11775 [Staphylococcus aureus subsp. aureus ST398]